MLKSKTEGGTIVHGTNKLPRKMSLLQRPISSLSAGASSVHHLQYWSTWGYWAAGTLVSCQDWRPHQSICVGCQHSGYTHFKWRVCQMCDLYRFITWPQQKKKCTCWTWQSLDSRISSIMSFPTWVAPCGVALHMWRRSLCCWPYFPGFAGWSDVHKAHHPWWSCGRETLNLGLSW